LRHGKLQLSTWSFQLPGPWIGNPQGIAMLYLVAILLPPLAVLLCGKPFQSIINVILTIAFYLPGQIHAVLVVHNHYADRRTERVIRSMRNQ
jgi:uncharacterized membrane protein YqaE (UPF0057 family)